jgi:hypothetical protein
MVREGRLEKLKDSNTIGGGRGNYKIYRKVNNAAKTVVQEPVLKQEPEQKQQEPAQESGYELGMDIPFLAEDTLREIFFKYESFGPDALIGTKTKYKNNLDKAGAVFVFNWMVDNIFVLFKFIGRKLSITGEGSFKGIKVGK